MSEGSFKTRYNNHNASYRLSQYKSSMKLSEAVWSFKENDTPYSIKWDIVKHGTPNKNGNKYCDLCTTEKVEIIHRFKDPRLLNFRSEIMAKCRHKKNVFVIILVILSIFHFPFSALYYTTLHFYIFIVNPFIFCILCAKPGIENNFKFSLMKEQRPLNVLVYQIFPVVNSRIPKGTHYV